MSRIWLRAVGLLAMIACASAGRAKDIEIECQGPYYDASADVIRRAGFKFAKAVDATGASYERVLVELNDGTPLTYGIGECALDAQGDAQCDVSSTVSSVGVPNKLSFARRGGEVRFASASGFKGGIPCLKSYTDFELIDIDFVDKPFKPGEPLVVVATIRDHRPSDIKECRGEVLGYRDGRNLHGGSLRDCMVRQGPDGTKILTLRGEGSPHIQSGHYFLQSIAIWTQGETWPSHRRGWGFDGFDVP